MTTAKQLWRSDLGDFAGYKSARSDAAPAVTWLNANEFPWPNPSEPEGRCRRYPDPQPAVLVDAMARLHGVEATQLLLGRGSDECIDLLVRAFCLPGRGKVVIAPPVFGMYAVCARLHGVEACAVPLEDGPNGFWPNLDAMAETALESGASVLFLCSPGNPTGEALPVEAIASLAAKLEQRCLVVVDEAYGEFCEGSSATALLSTRDNIAVLKTLSKAYAMAGARVGCVIANAEVIDCLRLCQAPYPIPEPVVSLALAAIDVQAEVETRARVARVTAERERMFQSLSTLPGVRRVYPSQANFLLVRVDDAEAVLSSLRSAGILVRDMRSMRGLEDAVRITIGEAVDNARVLALVAEALASTGVAACA